MIKFPKWNDVRWGAVSFQGTLLLVATFTGYLSHSWFVMAACLATAILLDLVCIRLKWGSWEFPVGSLSAAFGCMFFLRTFDLKILLMGVTVSVLSKYLVRFNGKHVFNPSNFGIVFMLLFFGHEVVAQGARWGTTLLFPAIVVLFGIPVLYWAKKLPLMVSLFTIFLIVAPLRALIFGGSPMLFGMIAISTGFVLSFFFMITDPATSPSSWKGQVLFAFTLVMIDQILRHFLFPDATQYAIFLTAALTPIFRMAHAELTGQPLQPFRHWSLAKAKA